MSYTINYPQTYTGNVTIDPSVSYAPTSAANYVWTNTTGTWVTNPVTITQKATIDLNGEDADLIINGESLKTTLAAFKERLAWLVPNPELEEQFDELKELRTAYEKLEAECKEKMRVWNILKDKNLDK